MKLFSKIHLMIYSIFIFYISISFSLTFANEYTETIYPSAGISLLTTKPLTPGEPADIGLTIFFRKGESVTYPKDENTFKPLKLIEVREKTRKTGRGRYKKLIIYTITSYRPGKYTLPSLKIMVGNEPINTEKITIEFLSVLPKNKTDLDLKGIKPIEKVKYLPYIIIALFITAAIGIGILILIEKIIKLFKSREKPVNKTNKTPEIQHIDPMVWVENSLNNLKKKIESNSINIAECYTEFSDIIRILIENVYLIPAKRMTTTELKKEIMNIRNKKDHYEKIIRILLRSDLVKFARDEPSRKILENDIIAVLKIVSLFKKKPLITAS